MNKIKMSMIIFLVCALSSVFFACQTAFADDHGDDFSQATFTSAGTSISGSINPSGDIDYFAFTVNQTATYVIYTRGITDTLGELYDANYSRLEYDRYSGEDDNFRIERSLTPGTYYMMVKGGSSYTTTGNYELHLEGPEAGTVSDDHGFSPWSASAVTVGSITDGSIDIPDDRDYFAFTVNQTATYVIYTRGITDTLGELYDANYSRLEYDRYSGEDDNFRIERSLTPGTYYMMVKGGSSYTTTGNYELHLEGPEAGTVSDDHGFSPWSASAVTVGSITDGSIDIPDDRDYFAFTVNQTATYVIYTRGITDTLGELYDANYSRLEYDRYSGEDDNFRIERSLTPGTYYMMVKGGSSYTTTGNYEFHLEGPEEGTPGPSLTPTVAQSPMFGPPGTVFIQWGTGFSPNGTVNIHIRKPNGTEYLPQTKQVDSNGNFEVTYVSQPNKPTGQYSWWAEDVNTGAMSNEVTYTVFAPSSQPPNTPKFLLLNSGSKLVISWTPVLDAKGYLFLYAPYPDVSYIGNIDMGTNTYLSGELPEGSAFYGAVVAYNDAGFGELSNIEHFVVETEICRAPFKGDGYFRIVNPTCEQRWKAFSYLNFESKRIRFLVKLLSGVVDGTIKVNELANILVEIGETVVSIRNLLGMSTGPIEDILTEGGFTIAGLDATLLNQELAQIWLNALESVLAGNPAPMVATAISTRINMFSIMGLSIETKILNSLTVAQTYLLDYYRFGEDKALLAQHYNLSSSTGINEVLDAVADRLSIDPGWFGFGRDYYRLGTKMMIDYLKNKVNQHADLF